MEVCGSQRPNHQHAVTFRYFLTKEHMLTSKITETGKQQDDPEMNGTAEYHRQNTSLNQ